MRKNALLYYRYATRKVVRSYMNSTATAVLLLLTGIASSGIYSVGLGPANRRCKTLSQLQLFNGCFTAIAMLCALTVAVLQWDSLYLPLSGILAAFAFGCLFSATVFTNLKALEEGPLSITTLIVNFSLIMPLAYSFIFLGEAVTLTRVVGIIILVICMVLFANPKVTGEGKFSVRWLVYSVLALLCNGTLSLISKIYSMHTDNAYAVPYLIYCYFFAMLVSFLLFFVLDRRQKEGTKVKAFFSKQMCGIILLVGAANYLLNLSVVRLATVMDGAIVYPAIQGGGPIIAALLSWILFKEHISLKKAAAIALGAAAIVLLNL